MGSSRRRASTTRKSDMQVDEVHGPGERGDLVGDAQLHIRRPLLDLLYDRRMVHDVGIEFEHGKRPPRRRPANPVGGAKRSLLPSTMPRRTVASRVRDGSSGAEPRAWCDLSTAPRNKQNG